jgi:hypothetical protein
MFSMPRLIAYVFGLVVVCAVAYMFMCGFLGLKELGTALLALISTFTGAFFAFRLNQYKDDKKESKEQVAALRKVLLTLVRQYNAVCSFEKSTERYSSPMEKAFNLPAFRTAPYSDLVFDFNELAFLLDSEDATAVLRLSIEQEGFHQTLESIRVRNDHYVDKYQPAFARSGLNGKVVNGEMIKSAVGEAIFGACITGAETMFENLAKSKTELPKVFDEFRAIAKRRFATEKFIAIEHA